MSNEKTLKKHSIKDDFSMMAILTIPVCVAVNFVGGQLASLLKLPMYRTSSERFSPVCSVAPGLPPSSAQSPTC